MTTSSSAAPKASVLIIDDEPASLKMLLTILTESGYVVHPSTEGEMGLKFAQRTLPDLVLVDIRMPHMDGYQVCKSLKDDPTTQTIPVIFISSIDQTIDKVRAFRSGAVDYVTKPFEAEEVLARIETHLALRRLQESLQSMVRERTSQLVIANGELESALQQIGALKEQLYRENIALREEIDKVSMFEEIVGTSPVLQKVLARVSKVAHTDSTVLITGETGTGKELIARAIHRLSQCATRAFVSVNCAAIPRELIASELFGHEKGAFTGATQRRLGRFELAEGGTIFLDEIGDLQPENQVALLRVLQEHEFQRVGGTQTIRTHVRVVAATHRDLQAAIVAGTFRSDLFYRLSVFPIEVPPLRQRREDVALLVRYFVDRYARKAGKNIRNIDKKSLELLQSYPWPGNIRELQNVIERSVIVCGSDEFSVDESWLSRYPVTPELSEPLHLSGKLAAQEKEMIEAALRECGGRVYGPLGAAAKLGIPRSTLESKIRSLKIDKRGLTNRDI